MSSHRFQWNFASLKALPQNFSLVSVLVFFGGEIDHPFPLLAFLGFHQGNRLKIGKMYEFPTAKVFNQLLWEFAYILLHPQLMSDARISQFYRRFVNQQRQINDCVFRRIKKSGSAESWAGTMAETALKYTRDFSNFRLSYERQIQTIGKTDDTTNPPREKIDVLSKTRDNFLDQYILCHQHRCKNSVLL